MFARSLRVTLSAVGVLSAGMSLASADHFRSVLLDESGGLPVYGIIDRMDTVILAVKDRAEYASAALRARDIASRLDDAVDHLQQHEDLRFQIEWPHDQPVIYQTSRDGLIRFMVTRVAPEDLIGSQRRTSPSDIVSLARSWLDRIETAVESARESGPGEPEEAGAHARATLEPEGEGKSASGSQPGHRSGLDRGLGERSEDEPLMEQPLADETPTVQPLPQEPSKPSSGPLARGWSEEGDRRSHEPAPESGPAATRSGSGTSGRTRREDSSEGTDATTAGVAAPVPRGSFSTEPRNRTGLRLTVDPQDAAAYVDGRFISVTGSAPILLQPGRHVLEVVRPGYGSFRKEIDVPEGRLVGVAVGLERDDSDAE